ncbi:MAG: hypothetical protein OXU69_14890 [Gemmatimonadota bacterium]|nr:hypothetical protein [Gemmatimonadota bacterium]MDE2985987.1 hypothetical protein [Gemmatimonadota bacterium]
MTIRKPLPPANASWPRRGVRVGACLMLAAGGCEPQSPEVGTLAGAAADLAVDTVTVVHSDLFFRIRSVRQIADGGLAVMNRGSRSLLLLDSRGDPAGTIGRLGEGPGDFLSVTDLDTKGDSILVLDAFARRVQLFHRASLVDTWSLREITGTLAQVTFSPDGAPVVSATRESPYPDPEDAMKVLREPVELYRIDDPATEIEIPVEIPGDEYFVVFVAARGGWRYGVPAFGAGATYDLTGTGVVAADARSGRVVSFPWGGQAVRTLRPSSPPEAMSEHQLDRLWASADTVARRLPDRDDYMTYVREAVEVWGESVPRPYYSAVISDGSETLLRHFTSGPADLSEWSLLAEDGELLGTFSLDRDTQLFSLQNREILGVGKDSLDVEHVIVGRIRGPF